MADYRLSMPQRNELYADAVTIGLDPASFRWSEERNAYQSPIHRIEHPPSGAYLVINYIVAGARSGYHFEYYPRSAALKWPGGGGWPALKTEIRKWLIAVKEEIDAPNLWALALQERAWITAPPSAGENTAFTPQELEQIRTHLRTIEAYTVKTYKLTAAQGEEVRERLAYLAEAAGRVGRFDWKNLVASTFIQIVLQVGLPPERAHDLLNFATQLLGPFVIGATRLLGGV